MGLLSRSAAAPLHATAAFVAILATCGVEAQRIERPAVDPDASVAASRSSIYASGDLILANPMQSTAIFLTVIVLSTAFEYILEFLMDIKNRYQRAIVLAVKEEVVCMAFTHMVLLWASFSFPFTTHWHTVIQFVAVTVIYMAFTYIFMTASIVVLLSRRMSSWRTFEWSAISAISQHDKSEQQFRLARQVYLAMLPFDVPGAEPSGGGRDGGNDEDGDGDNVDDPNAALLFSSVLTVLERKHVQSFTDFTPVTWIGLALLITVNGFRAVTVVSIGLGDEGTRIAQSLSFIATGYAMALALFVMSSLLFRRGYSRLFGRAAKNNGCINPAKRTAAERKSDADEFKRVLFFSNVGHTMQIFKVFWLGLIWYSAHLVVGIFYVLWRDFGWYSLILDAIAIVPPLLALVILPGCFVCAILTAAIGADFDPRIARAVLDGDIDVNDHDIPDEDGDAADGSGWAGIASSGVDFSDPAEGALKDDDETDGRAVSPDPSQPGQRRLGASQQQTRDNEPELPDEWSGPAVTFHDGSPDPPTTAPTKVLGVRPVLNDRSLAWNVRQRRPVFDDTALLRRDADIL